MIPLSFSLTVLIPGLAGVGLLFLEGRWRRRGLMAAAILAQGYLSLTIPLEASTEILGLSLEWSALARLFLPVFGLLSLAMLIQSEDPPYGPHFASLGLFVLAALNGSLISSPLLAASLLIVAGLIGLFFIPQRPRLERSWQAAHRYLAQTFVGGMALILGLLLVEAQRTALVGLPLLRIGVGLLALGFAMRLGIIPLHQWLVEMEEHALDMASALILGLINVATLIFLVVVFLEKPPAVIDPRAHQLFSWGGALSIGLGSLLGLAQSSPRRLVAFSTIYDLGFIFYGVSSVTELGWLGALWGILHHGTTQVLLRTSLTLAQARRKDPDRPSSMGILGFWGGGLALVGMPPLSPSLGRWMILTVALKRHWVLGSAMLGASAVMLLAYLRMGLRLFLGPIVPLGSNGEPESWPEQDLGQPAVARLVTGLILAAMLILNFYPHPIIALLQQAIRSFAFPVS